jgi:hypothetical protein
MNIRKKYSKTEKNIANDKNISMYHKKTTQWP